MGAKFAISLPVWSVAHLSPDVCCHVRMHNESPSRHSILQTLFLDGSLVSITDKLI